MIRTPAAFRCLATLALCLATQASAGDTACDDPRSLRFSPIPKKNLTEQLQDYRPLLQRLEQVSRRRVEVVMPASYNPVVEGLLSGNIDVAELGPASYVLAKNRDDGILPFATTTKPRGFHTEAGNQYLSLLVVRRSDGFENLTALAGHSIGLTDPASTSGAVLPGNEFSGLVGKPLPQYFSRLIYTGSHDRSIDTLMKGHVDAAFISSSRIDEYIRRGKIRADDLQVLWKSSPIPYDPFVLRGRLCPELQEDIRRAFLSDSPELSKTLANLKASRFVPAGEADYEGLRALLTGTR